MLEDQNRFTIQDMSFNAIKPFLIGTILLLVGGCESELARRVSKYEKTRDYQSAKRLLQRTARKDPDNAEAQFLLGRLLMRQGAYEEGTEAFKKSREASARFVERIDFLKEKYAREEFKKGKKDHESGSFGDAVRHFRSVTLIQPSNATAYRALGLSLVQADRAEEGRVAYKKSLKLEPSAEVLNNLAALAFQREAYSEAIKYSRRALGLINKSENQQSEQAKAKVVKRLAYAYLRTDQFMEASERFDEALRIAPSKKTRRDYAFALYNRDKHKEALPHLKKLASGKKIPNRVLHALGDTYLSLDQHQRAKNVYLRIHKSNPKDEDAIQSLAIVYKILENEKKSKSYIDKLEKMQIKE